MRYHLRTLLIVLAIGPPMLAAIWPSVKNMLWPPQPLFVPSGTFPIIHSGTITQTNISTSTSPAPVIQEELPPGMSMEDLTTSRPEPMVRRLPVSRD
jgi:hypothetical protein